MSNKTPRALRQDEFKSEPMTPISLRLPPQLWARCGWQAQAEGLGRAEFVRSALTRATRDAKPPKSPTSRVIDVPPAKWARWQRAAQRDGMSMEEYITASADGHAAKTEGTQDADAAA